MVDMFPHSKKGREARDRFFLAVKPHLLGIDDVTTWPGSGVGKGTLIDKLLKEHPNLFGFSVRKSFWNFTEFGAEDVGGHFLAVFVLNPG
jgi:hypothetical protein